MHAILLLSGPIAVGKSTVASQLLESHHFCAISSSQYLKGEAAEKGLSLSRNTLQALGDQLDIDTGFAWLVDNVAIPQIGATDDSRWFVDAVRKEQQVALFRATFERTCHVHFTAPESILRARFDERLAREGPNWEGPTSYEEAVAHPNEAAARALIEIADAVIDLVENSPAEAAKAAAAVYAEEG